ncbi:eCIS core domain-containing protein [Saccharothrix obliqua]|uniref:eCIS core domain-containing protein n=1 Tax=Saccharothrix obliqua TaxID=2861747 RepID=UPI001C6037FD|nr:DUF4157 domain-containing protein [Saccharothrix obliqua]MBW4718650.1 DUF4157 domain-containing protein [Saccharothrix obliqua]
MRAHEEPEQQRTRRAAERAEEVRTPSGLSPGLLAALQRSVGNAAVAGLVTRAADPATSGAVDVLRSAGRPLATPVRQEMEARLGADFGSVRVHDDHAAREAAAGLGARAFTSGDHVVIGDGGGDRHTLAHELTHVIQQREGPVSGTDNGSGLRVSDPGDRFERAAEENARTSLARPLPDRPVEGGNGEPTTGAVQRALLVGTDDLSQRYRSRTENLPPKQQRVLLNEMVQNVVNQFMTVVKPEFTAEERKAFWEERARIRYQLEKAIVSPIGHRGTHPVLARPVGANTAFGAKNHDIRVANYTDLARNLMGWVYAKDKRREEKAAANRIQDEGEVEQVLNVLLRRIRHRIDDIEDGRVEVRGEPLSKRKFEILKEELTTGLSHLESQPKVRDKGDRRSHHDPAQAGKPIGSYLAYFAMDPKFEGSSLRSKLIEKGGVWALLRRPHDFSFRDKLIALHDLSEYFGHSRHTPPTMGKTLVPEIGDREKASTTGYREDGTRITAKDRGQVAVHPSTRNENSPTTRLARSRNLPVWAGQSYTAARMFKMAEEFGASQEEIAAVAWGIFSFWRVDFDHTTEYAYHTLHEVMDISQNFGLDYHVDDQYASLSLVDVKKITGKLEEVRNTTRAVHEDARQQVEELKTALRGKSRNREVREAQKRFLDIAQDVADELGDIRRALRKRAEEAESWDGLSGRDRTCLLAYCLDDLKGVRRRVGRLDDKLARVERR